MAYNFHYTPTGTGVISGKEVLEQTEDAINDLGNTAISGVQEALDKAEQALTNSENAVDDAQTALNTANNAEGVAIQAQNDVSNLSGTVTNIGNRVTSAEGNISNLQGRMTTAEGNISNLQGRMTTAEGNIGNLQTAVSTAQATANSAQQTATTARQQSYVFRYSSTALTASSTNANSLLDNTDNLKVGDKVIDSSGVLFSITAIDTANSTFTVGSALIDLALDSDVVHKSGNETIDGSKTFTDNNMIKTSSPKVLLINTSQTGNTPPSSNTASFFRFDGGTVNNFGGVQCEFLTSGENRLTNYVKDISTAKLNSIQQRANNTTAMTVFNADLIIPSTDGITALGSSAKRWSDIYGVNYYYGSNNVEFSTKFVTTDTNQTISGVKTFGNGTLIVDNTTGSNVHGEIKLNGSRPGYIVADNASDGVFDSAGCGVSILLQDPAKPLHVGAYKVDANGRVFVDNTNKNPVLSITSGLIRTLTLIPESDTGNSSFRILSQIDYANGNPSKTLDVRFIQYDNANATSAIYSNEDNKTSLGVSSKKWSDVLTYKVNGVEPSSLSLPSGDASNFIDISSYFTNTGSGDTNSYTALANGWIYLRLGDISSCQATVYDASNNRMWGQSSTGSVEQITVPILKGQTFTTQWNTSTTVNVANARFIPCQGNV